MVSFAQKVYWQAPAFLKNWMASLNAVKLDAQRYRGEYAALLAEIHGRDHWTPEQWQAYQREAFLEQVRHCNAHVPFYRKAWTGLGVEGFTGLEDLVRLPILEKTTVREDPEAFVDDTLDKRSLIVANTSGTTGTPLRLYRDLWLNSAVFAYGDARCRESAFRKVRFRRRENGGVTLGAHLVTAPDRSRPPFWVYNARWKQLYMSSYHLSPRNLGSYVDELRRFRGEYIEGFASSLYAIAKYILDHDLPPVPFQAAYTQAEKTFPHMHEAIERAFACRIYDQYGAQEMVVAASECEAGSMHLSPDYGLVEILDPAGNPMPPGQSGSIVCTSLVNRVQPLIRYRIGDLGSLKPGTCPCGCPMPMLGDLEGRTDSVFITRDGRRIGLLDSVFKGIRGIIEAQIVQDDYDRFRIRIVKGASYQPAEGEAMTKGLLQRVGDGHVTLEFVDRIERTASGKFRALVCNLPALPKP